MAIDFLDELRWRGLLFQCTDEDRLAGHLGSGVRRAYAGFDPTADSLTIGNMVPIMALIHLARAGHEPVVLMGGGTGLIGDPSGKSAERMLMTEDQVAANVESQRGIFRRMFANAGVGEPRVVNNLDWLGDLGFIEVLRDVGKHFSVNMMMQKDSVRSRLEDREHGISYTEFSYMILQAYDFAHLFEAEGITVQLGGSDQWGNIVAGADLIRRKAAAPAWEAWRKLETDIKDKGKGGAFLSEAQKESLERSQSKGEPAEAFGLTCPLVTKSDGGKFGKTEEGAIWLTAPGEGDASSARTSAYAMFQFWLNTSDDDVVRFLKLFTLLERDAIDEIAREHLADPGKRAAQRALAEHATDLVHGQAERERAERAARALFSGEIADLDESTLEAVLAEAPSSQHERSLLEGAGVSMVDLLVETGLAQSKRQAREFLQNGSVSVNGEKVGLEATLGPDDLLHGRIAAIRRGKKSWHVTRWA